MAPAPDPLAALDAAGRRLRRAALAAGLLKTAAVAVIAGLFATAADAAIGGFPADGLTGARLLVLIAALLAAARWLIEPLRRPADRAALAAAADRGGGTADRLAAALALPAGPLRERLLTATPPAAPAPRRGRFRWALAGLASCGVALGVWFAAAPTAAAAAIARVSGAAGEAPLRLRVADRTVPLGTTEITVSAGAELTVQALGTRRRLLHDVRWRTAGADFADAGDGAIRLSAATDPVTVAAAADGFRPALLTLRPLPAPAVAGALVVVRRPDGGRRELIDPTEVTVEPGESLRLYVEPTRPAAVEFVLPPGTPRVTETPAGPTLAAPPPGEWPIVVRLVPRERPFAPVVPRRLASEPRPLFLLRVERDEPPTVRLTAPPEGATVTPAGRVPLAAIAADDRPDVRLELLAEGEPVFASEHPPEKAAAAARSARGQRASASAASELVPTGPDLNQREAETEVAAPADSAAGGSFTVGAAATDAGGQRAETPPRRVLVITEDAKRAELEAAVPPLAAALERAATAAAEIAGRVGSDRPPTQSEVRRTVERLGRSFAAPTAALTGEAERDAVPPGPRLAAAVREAGAPLGAVRDAAERLHAALREGEDARPGAGAFAARLAESAARLRQAVEAADGAERSEELREDQRVLTDRTAAAAPDFAALAERQRALVAALAGVNDGPAAELLRDAVRALTAGRQIDAVARQREALSMWDQTADGSPDAPATAADPEERAAALAVLADRQRAAAGELEALAASAATGRSALRVLRRIAGEERGIADALGAFARSADPATAAAAGASAREVAAVAAGAEAREPAGSIFPPADRAAARLEALANREETGDGESSPAQTDGAESSDDPAPDVAALVRWQRFLLERTRGSDPDAAALAAEQRALAGTLPAESTVATTAGEAAERLAGGDLVGAAERQRATLALLEEIAAGDSGTQSIAAASPSEQEAGRLPDGEGSSADSPPPDPSAAGTATDAAGSGGTGAATGGGLGPAGPSLPWGRLPARLRERLADAADRPAAPGFADLTARYRDRLSRTFAPPPSSTPRPAPP